MEFLMTYGWSILIIAVVLGGALPARRLQLREPRAQRAADRELQGPQDRGDVTNLEGTCSGVAPQSVAMFNGASSYVECR